MRSPGSVTDSWSERLIVGVAVAAIVVGIALRCTNIPDKLFWHDEAHGALRVSGFTASDLSNRAFQARVLTRDEVLDFQHPAENLSLARTLAALTDEPQHPPLYYLATRVGFEFSDDPRIAMRSVAVAAGLLLLPALYWLWMELFGTRRGALMLVALVALSPLQVIYSQEGRQYSLWAALAIAATAALLCARRRESGWAWSLYALLAILGLHTHLLFGATLVAHAVWMLWECGRTDRKALVRFSVALGLAGLSFLPWLALLVKGLGYVRATTDWLRVPMPLADLVDVWVRQLARQFIDVPGVPTIDATLAAALSIASLVIFTRHAASGARKLVLLSFAMTTGVVLGPDLLIGGRASITARYLLPALLWVAVCVSYALDWMVARPGRATSRAGIGAWLAVLVVGLWSSILFVRADFWWHKAVQGDNNLEVAQQLNAAGRPLLVVEGYDINSGQMLSLSHSVDPRLRFLPIRVDKPLPVDALTGDVFVLNPTAAMLEQLREIGPVEALDEEGHLWTMHRRGDIREAAGSQPGRPLSQPLVEPRLPP